MYWLQRIFDKASEFKTLESALRNSEEQQLKARMVVPKLAKLSLRNSRISAGDVLAMIGSSRESHTHITFQQVVLNHGSLTSFTIAVVRETNGGGPAVDFREVRDEDIPEDCRAGVKLTPKGPSGNQRMTRLAYSGADAGKVLEVIATAGYVPESYESGRGQAGKSA